MPKATKKLHSVRERRKMEVVPKPVTHTYDAKDPEKAPLAPETAIVQKVEMPIALRLKLGSIIVHIEEALSANAHGFDLHAIAGLIQDQEIRRFMEETAKMGILPVKR